MSTTDLSGSTAVVVGASRGLGRGVAMALAGAGASVVALSRTGSKFDGRDIEAVVADATLEAEPARVFARYAPQAVVIVAGATPAVRPLHEHTWETFSANWETDVRIAFNWARGALLAPLAPGSRVIVFSSGAALQGSPLSGGYAGAKATQRFITQYAQDESQRAGLGITFTAVLPRITPAGDVSLAAIEAYAGRAGKTVDEYLAGFGAPLTADVAGAAVVDLVLADAAGVAAGYLLTGAGLKQLP